MITKRLKLFTAITTSLVAIVLPKAIVNACGFYVAPSQYRFWLLQPDLTNKTDLTPFFFSSGYLYNGDQWAGGAPHVAQNTDEWFSEVKKQASKKDIDTILNHTDPKTFFTTYKSIAQSNTYLRYLLRPENKELFQYLIICKKLEQPLATPDPWGEQGDQSILYTNLIPEIKELNKKARSPFLKLRSAYQLMRMYYYTDQESRGDSLYDAAIGPVNTNSWIKSAALFQKARNANGAKNDYLLSKVFDRGDYNRVTCLVEFSARNLDSALLFAKNAHEKTVLRAMKVFNYPGKALDYLQQIYLAKPRYKDLSFLLLREINKVEDLLVTGKVTEFEPVFKEWYGWYEDEAEPSSYEDDKIYAGELYDFINKIIAENKTKEKSLFHLYASHVAMLLGKYEASLEHLKSARDFDLPANVRMQIRVNTLLLNMHMGTMEFPAFEKELLSIVQVPDEKSGVYDFNIMREQLILYCGQKLIDKGYKAKGLMLLGKTNRAIGRLPVSDFKTVYHKIEEIATVKEYDEIIAIIKKKNKSAFEKYLANDPLELPYNYYEENSIRRLWNIDMVLDGKSRWHIKNNQLQEALATLNRISDSYWKQYPYDEYIKGDPFYVDIYAPYERAPGEKGYDKKRMVSEMIRLQELAKKDPGQAALCYYKLGCAWYNMSYYGKYWLMTKRWWSINDPYSETSRENYTNDNYFGCIRAKEFFVKAMNTTNDKKLGALSGLMADKCNNNYQEYVFMQDPRNYENTFATVSNPYLSTLKKKGMDKYYEEIVDECATYQSFVKAYH